MLDDGSVQARVALVRPMDEIRFEVRQLEETNWEQADEQSFSAAWNAEVADLPEFSLSTMHVVSGLLLPIWKLLPQDYCRVYRLETDDGERIVGRLISSEGLSPAVPQLRARPDGGRQRRRGVAIAARRFRGRSIRRQHDVAACASDERVSRRARRLHRRDA